MVIAMVAVLAGNKHSLLKWVSGRPTRDGLKHVYDVLPALEVRVKASVISLSRVFASVIRVRHHSSL